MRGACDLYITISHSKSRQDKNITQRRKPTVLLNTCRNYHSPQEDRPLPLLVNMRTDLNQRLDLKQGFFTSSSWRCLLCFCLMLVMSSAFRGNVNVRHFIHLLKIYQYEHALWFCFRYACWSSCWCCCCCYCWLILCMKLWYITLLLVCNNRYIYWWLE